MDGFVDLTAQGTGVQAAADTAGMVFDLSGVGEAPKYEVIPRGTYNAIVESVDFGQSSSDNPMITMVFSITDPEFEGRKIYEYYVLGGEGAKYALPKLTQFLTRVCPDVPLTGFNPASFADNGVAVNRACQITLKITTQKKGDYKGEKRNQITEVLAGGSTVGSFGL